METKLNIANILKNKPKGTKLYADAFGELKFVKVDKVDTIYTRTKEGMFYSFYNDGKYNKNGEPILVPSKEMRDWSKFAWKKGDILVSNDSDCHIIFEGFSKDDYTTFKGKHWVSVSKKRHISFMNMQNTQNYYIEDDKDAAQTYINTIEERFGDKLNRKTLEIEKQPKFKDGDILYVKTKKLGSEYIIINKLSKEAKTAFYVAYNLSSKKIFCNLTYFVCCDKEISILRQATDYEKSQLFEALAKEDKTWDAEKKQIVNLKPNVELKPFDKVLVRDGKDEIWEPAFFFRNLPKHNVYKYQTVDGKLRVYCIPFNEETAKLIGTSNDWEE